MKEFKETKALDDVTLSFESGKIHGIVGRNGSGKTVLLKCICGFMELTSGQILVQGQKVVPAKPQNIGIIIESPGFIGSQSGIQELVPSGFSEWKVDAPGGGRGDQAGGIGSPK